ncbi:MAG: hypothetical protein LH473_04900 [Chitinophagales bacterium]|nr:hypothetical protein [Chitinophagales bacterium]
MIRLLTVSSLLFFIASCLNPPDYSIIPAIGFDSLSNNIAKVNEDSITIYFNFTDGDGDIGSDDIPNMFFTDSRTGYPDSFKIPNVTPGGTVKAISGEVAYTFSQFNCIPGRIKDSLFYTIYIEDRAGNKSNEIITPTITLICQ